MNQAQLTLTRVENGFILHVSDGETVAVWVFPAAPEFKKKVGQVINEFVANTLRSSNGRTNDFES